MSRNRIVPRHNLRGCHSHEGIGEDKEINLALTGLHRGDDLLAGTRTIKLRPGIKLQHPQFCYGNREANTGPYGATLGPSSPPYGVLLHPREPQH